MYAVLHCAVDGEYAQRGFQFHVLIALIGMFAASVDGQVATTLKLRVSLDYHATFLTATVSVCQHVLRTVFQYDGDAFAILDLYGRTRLAGQLQSFERQRNLEVTLMDKRAVVALT